MCSQHHAHITLTVDGWWVFCQFISFVSVLIKPKNTIAPIQAQQKRELLQIPMVLLSIRLPAVNAAAYCCQRHSILC